MTMDLAVASRHLLLEKFINVCPIFDSHCTVLPFFSYTKTFPSEDHDASVYDCLYASLPSL